MTSHRSITAALLISGALAAQGFTSPAGYTTTEGSSNHDYILFKYNDLRWQQLDATSVGQVPFLIQRISWRRDGVTGADPTWIARTIDVGAVLSNSVLPGAISEGYAANYSGTPTNVFISRPVNLPDWTANLGSPAPFNLSLPLDLPGGTIRRVARHELVHLFVGSLALACPAWLNEGLAQWLEPADPSRDKLGLARALAADRLHPMADLSADLQALGEADRIALAYAQSLSFVAFLQAKGSLEGVLDLVRAPTQGRSLDDACRARYRVGFAELEAEWRGTLSGR